MKNATLLLRWPCLLQDVSHGRLLNSKQPAVAPKETITHHFSFLEIARRKLLM